jgi:hypothetical protein
MCSFLQEHSSYCGRRVFLGSVRRYERELERAELNWWEMDDDIPVGCEDLHRAKLAREARKEANRRKANRYCRTPFKEILLRKEWGKEFKNRLRHTPVPVQVFSSACLTAQQAPLPSHAKSALIIIIDDNDDDDDDEVIFAGTGQIPVVDDTAALVVVDDNPVVSFLPSLDPNT